MVHNLSKILRQLTEKKSAVGVVVTFQISILKPRFRLPDGALQFFLFILYIMPKSRRRRRRRKHRRRGAGSYGRRDAWDNVARRMRVSDDAAAAARRRTRRLAGRNVDPRRRREWMQGPRGHGRRWIARHAAAAGRAHQRHKTRADRRVLRKTAAAGGTRRRRRR